MIVDVEFTGTWLSSLLDPTVSIRMLKTAREEDDGIEGQVVNYAGRSVAETTTKRTRTTPLTLVRAGDAQRVQLQTWWLAKTPLLMRDGQGWWRTGVIFGGKITDLLPNGILPRLYTVEVTFNDIDYTAN